FAARGRARRWAEACATGDAQKQRPPASVLLGEFHPVGRVGEPERKPTVGRVGEPEWQTIRTLGVIVGVTSATRESSERFPDRSSGRLSSLFCNVRSIINAFVVACS